jgi:hypothetical protein
MLVIVTNRPEMLMGVSGSLKTIAAAEMVTTSLKMPQIERVTTDVLWRRLRGGEGFVSNEIWVVC